MKISSMFEFAFGKEVNFGNQINTLPYMTTLDFTKDVEGYGFAIRDGIDADLSKIKNISSYISTSQRSLRGVIEFKTEKSGGAPEKTAILTLPIVTTSWSIHKLSSPLKEIVLWFPKEKNSGKIDTLFNNFEATEA